MIMFLLLIIFMIYGNTLCTDVRQRVNTRESAFTAEMIKGLEEGEDVDDYIKGLKMPKRNL